jgi:hypothetical protein
MRSRIFHAIGIVLFLCGCMSSAHGQLKPAIFFNAGYSSYDAKQMKAQVVKAHNTFPQTKIVANFPAYFAYTGGISVYTDREDLMFTAFAGHSSTGSRISYGDYSGHVYEDFLVKTNMFGGSIAAAMIERHGYALWIGLRYTLNLNSLKVITELQSPSDYSHDEYSFVNKTNGLEPYVAFSKKLNRFAVRIEAGYSFQSHARWHLPDNKRVVLADADTQEDIKYNGSGFRLSAGVSFFIFKQSNGL